MLIPLGTDQPRRRPTLITWWIIGLNVAIHAAMVVIDRVNPDLHAELLAMFWMSWDASGIGVGEFHWWSPMTYQFLHGGMLHLIGNCLFLFVFGPLVEDRFKRVGFAAFYLAGGAFAGFVHLLLGGQMTGEGGQSVYFVAPVIGASGSIAAVTGAFLVMFPLVGLRVLLFFIIIGIFTIPAWWLIILNVARDLLMSGSGQRIAYMAHLGGYAMGFAVAWALLSLKVIARQPYDLFSLNRQAARRRQFKEAATRGGAKSPWLSDARPVSEKSSGHRRREKHNDSADSPTKGAGPIAQSSTDHALMERRSTIAKQLAAGELEQAARDYERLLDDDPKAMLHREAQLDIANALFANGRHQAAIVAYQLLLTKYPHGREGDEVRLLMALINARYLNDPVEAKRLIGLIDATRLDASHRALLETLRDELG